MVVGKVVGLPPHWAFDERRDRSNRENPGRGLGPRPNDDSVELALVDLVTGPGRDNRGDADG